MGISVRKEHYCMYFAIKYRGLCELFSSQYIIAFSLMLGTSHSSAFGIATAYGLDNKGVGVRVPVGSRIFTSLYNACRL
jgi:hypothetical protein